MAKIAFLGLGAMGFHMAGHLFAKLPNQLMVWNRTKKTSQLWASAFSGAYADSIEQAVTDADVVFSCLGRDEDVDAVILQSGGASNFMKAGAILVDHTTTSALLARSLENRLAEIDAAFMDAPVSGGEEGAKKGLLSCMLGGQQETLNEVKHLLDCYCQKVVLIGDTGAGQLAKMANQICIAGVLQGLSEAMRFSEAENLDIAALLEAISGGAAQSWQMNNRANTMHAREFDFGFALKWMVKDLGYCLDQAAENGVDLELAGQVLQSYQRLMEEGHASKDTSALILDHDSRV